VSTNVQFTSSAPVGALGALHGGAAMFGFQQQAGRAGAFAADSDSAWVTLALLAGASRCDPGWVGI